MMTFFSLALVLLLLLCRPAFAQEQQAEPEFASARIGGKTVFRVRMGPYGSASELAEAKRKLASGGLPAMAIKVE